MKMFRFFMAISILLLLLLQNCWALDSLYVRRVGICATREQAYEARLSGGYAYIANDDSGVRVIDLTNLSTPVMVGRYNDPVGTSNWAQGLFVVDTLVYQADRGGGIRILSAADPANLVLRGSLTTAGSARGVFVRDTIAYVAADLSGLRILTVNNPAAITELGSLTFTTGNAYAVKVVDTVAYVTLLTGGLAAVSVANPRSPYLLSTLPAMGTERIIDVFIDSSKAFLANAGGLKQRIVNVSNPSAMAYIDSITIDSARSVTKQDTLVFWSGASMGFNIVSYVSGGHPTLQAYHHKMGAPTAPGYGRGITVQDTFVYLASDAAGLVIYNFGALFHQQHINVLNPTSRDTMRSRDYTTIRWSSQNVYDSVRIQVSRSSPLAWHTIGTAAVEDTSFTWRVYNPANTSYTSSLIRIVSMDDSSIIGTSTPFIVRPPAQFISVSSPTAGELWSIGSTHTIRWLHSDSLPVTVGIVRAGQQVRFGTTTADTFVWTVNADTSTNVYVRIAQIPDSFYIAISPYFNIVLDAANDPAVPREFSLKAAYPNPFNATTTIRYSLPSASEMKVNVYNILGSSVYESERKLPGPGNYSLELNGNEWSSGVYFVRIQAGTHSGLMKVVLLK